MPEVYIQDINGAVADASNVTTPPDRYFREAWVLNGAVITEDLSVAKDIFRDKVREVRKPLLEAEDVTYMKALESDNADAKLASVLMKETLRNAPAAAATAVPAKNAPATQRPLPLTKANSPFISEVVVLNNVVIKEVRPLTALEPEVQNAVWQETVEKHGENITANKVQEVANDWKETSKEIKQQKNEGVFVAATDKDILKKAKEIKEQKAAAYKQKIVERIENKVSQTEISQEEQDLIDKLSSGETIVININKHFHVLKEAKERGLYYQIDRYSSYGNPFFLDTDGNRDEVCDGYIEYFKHKRSLHNKVKELKGKALGCHCAPLRCHGDHLKSLADEN